MAGGYDWPPRLVPWPSAVSVLTISRNDRPSPGRSRARDRCLLRPFRHELAVRHEAHAERHESARTLSRWPLTLACGSPLRRGRPARPLSQDRHQFHIPGAQLAQAPGVVPQLTAGPDGITSELPDLVLPIMLRLAVHDRDPRRDTSRAPAIRSSGTPAAVSAVSSRRQVLAVCGCHPKWAGAKAAEASPGSARGLPHHQAGPIAANGSSMTSTRLASSSVTRPQTYAAHTLISATTGAGSASRPRGTYRRLPGYWAVCSL